MMNTFWENNHPLQSIADELQERFPVYGEVENTDANPALERFRKGVQLYHEIFNNGCCNYSKGCKEYFGISGRQVEQMCRDRLWESIHEYTEPGMEKLVIAAAAEQLAKSRL